MKNIAVKILAAALLLTLVGCEVTDATSSLVSSEDASVVGVSSEETSSKETSSEETSSEEISSEETSSEEEKELKDFILEDGFLDVQAAGLAIASDTDDDSYLFIPTDGVEGYEINGGTYLLDAETLRRLTTIPCRGNGRVRWKDYKNWAKWTGAEEQTEYVPADLINDPIYMSMVLPSERPFFLSERINPAFMAGASEKWTNVMTIGATYRNMAVEIPDEAEFTLCISDINLAIRTKSSDGWFVAKNIKVPTVYNKLFFLPWQQATVGISNRVTEFEDHVEIKLTGADLNGVYAKQLSDKVEQCVYHYWGKRYEFDCSGEDVLGIVSSYTIWVKEPEASEYLVATIGADWRDKSGKILQALAGRSYAVTNEPRTLIGHTVPPSKWDEIVGDESEKIQELIGLK